MGRKCKCAALCRTTKLSKAIVGLDILATRVSRALCVFVCLTSRYSFARVSLQLILLIVVKLAISSCSQSFLASQGLVVIELCDRRTPSKRIHEATDERLLLLIVALRVIAVCYALCVATEFNFVCYAQHSTARQSSSHLTIVRYKFVRRKYSLFRQLLCLFARKTLLCVVFFANLTVSDKRLCLCNSS